MPLMRNGQENVEFIRIRIELIEQPHRLRSRIGVGNREDQSVWEDSRRFRDREVAGRQLLLVDLQRGESPRLERERLGLESKGVLQEPVLRLEVLRAEERALHPDDRLELFHVAQNN